VGRSQGSAAKTRSRDALCGRLPSYGKLDTDKLTAIVGTKGSLTAKFTNHHRRDAEMHGMKLAEHGPHRRGGIAGTDDAPSIDGDFAMTASEVQPCQGVARGWIIFGAAQPHERRNSIYLLHALLGKGKPKIWPGMRTRSRRRQTRRRWVAVGCMMI